MKLNPAELEGQRILTGDGRHIMVMMGMLLESFDDQYQEMTQVAGQGKWEALKDEETEQINFVYTVGATTVPDLDYGIKPPKPKKPKLNSGKVPKFMRGR